MKKSELISIIREEIKKLNEVKYLNTFIGELPSKIKKEMDAFIKHYETILSVHGIYRKTVDRYYVRELLGKMPKNDYKRRIIYQILKGTSFKAAYKEYG